MDLQLKGKVAIVGGACFVSLVAGCATSIPTDYQTPKDRASPGIECFGLNASYAFLAEGWTQTGDGVRARRESFSIANAFDFELVDKLRLQAASARLTFDGKNLVIAFYSKSGSLLSEVREPAAIRKCGSDATVVSISQVLAADGARENQEMTVSIGRVPGKMRVETAVERQSSLLFIRKVRRYNYVSEFALYTGK
jgi:hypothetical protein